MTIANKLKSLYDNLVIAINFINERINLRADKVFYIVMNAIALAMISFSIQYLEFFM